MKSVTIVDYGIGNIYSVFRGFESQGAEVKLTSDPKEIESADRLVLPGVGAFQIGMAGLGNLGLIDSIKTFSQSERPFLGICLGMQMLMETSSEFGEHPGLGLIPGSVRRIQSIPNDGEALRIPHIGWNQITEPSRQSSIWPASLLAKTSPGAYVYFVHSFVAQPTYEDHVLAVCHYGSQPLVAAVKSGSVMGCQFHPERSGHVGLQMIESFLDL